MALRLKVPAATTIATGAARTVDLQLDIPGHQLGNSTALVTNGMARGGSFITQFLISAGGVFGIRNGRACNVHNNGNGGTLSRIIPHRVATPHGGTMNPEYMGVVGVRVLLAINAQMDVDAAGANPGAGVLLLAADLRSTVSYHLLVNDPGNIRDRGFGLVRYNGAWRFMARKFDNDLNPVPIDENTVLDWPTADLEEFVAADFIFRQQTAHQSAQFELRLNGTTMLTRDWADGSPMPAPDVGRAPSCGWGLFLTGCSGPAADGRELRVAGMHYVAGPDEDGVLW